MKKVFTLLLAAIVLLSLAACGDQPTSGSSDNSGAPQSSQNQTDNDTPDGSGGTTVNEEIENQVALSLDKTHYEYDERIAVTLDFAQLNQDTAVIVLVNSDREHGSEALVHDDYEEYRWLADFSELPFYLWAPEDQDGLFDVRVYANSEGGEELASITIAVGNATRPNDNATRPNDSGAHTPPLAWPSAGFITPGMQYTGGGAITYIDYIDGSTQENGMSQYSVYINGGTLDDAQAYIDALKADGFIHYSPVGASEPEAAFEFGFYEWKGEADGGDRFIIVYVGEEVETYGMSGAEYTMYIMMMDQNMYA